MHNKLENKKYYVIESLKEVHLAQYRDDTVYGSAFLLIGDDEPLQTQYVDEVKAGPFTLEGLLNA